MNINNIIINIIITGMKPTEVLLHNMLASLTEMTKKLLTEGEVTMLSKTLFTLQ